jgi:HSP20 family protein
MRLIIEKISAREIDFQDSMITDMKELLLGLEDVEEVTVPEEEPDAKNMTDVLAEDTAGPEEITVTETNRGYIIQIPLTGPGKEDITIEVDDEGTLTVTATNKTESFEEKGAAQTRRITENVFTRSFRLPDDANDEDIEGWYENETLVLVVPKIF